MANNSRIFADAANTSVDALTKHENSSVIGIEAYKDLIDHKNVFANKTTKGHVVPGFTILIKDGVAYSRVSNLAINILAFQGNVRLGSGSSYKAVYYSYICYKCKRNSRFRYCNIQRIKIRWNGSF